MRLRISKLFFSLMVIAGTLSVPAFAIDLQPGFDTGPLAASQVTPSCQNWSKNLSCADNNQQAVDDVVDQLSSGGGSAWTLTDGTHSVANVGQVTVTGGTVGGTSPNATLTITGTTGNIDGGNSLSIYLPAQILDGGVS